MQKKASTSMLIVVDNSINNLGRQWVSGQSAGVKRWECMSSQFKSHYAAEISCLLPSDVKLTT